MSRKQHKAEQAGEILLAVWLEMQSRKVTDDPPSCAKLKGTKKEECLQKADELAKSIARYKNKQQP